MTWQPHSTCGPHCLPPSQGKDRVGVAQQAGRLAAFVLVLVAAAAMTLVLPLLGPAVKRRMLRAWAQAALAALGIRATGTPVAGNRRRTGRLIVANHISWLDILAVMTVAPSLLLAKREVASWPVIGAIARRAGTIFIDRGDLRTLPQTVDLIAARLRQGNDVAVFPEGTTWCGAHTGRWYPAAFQAAIQTGSVIQPLRLAYQTPDTNPATAAAFLGEETLLSCLGRISVLRGLTIEIGQSAPLAATAAQGRSQAVRRELARLAGSAPPPQRVRAHQHRATIPPRPARA
jgi:1-acyl-sn-glycerol-3-phosphate acyltransferase